MSIAYQIGHWYRVPCMWVEKHRAWLPTLGPYHEDKEIIGFPEPHYHVDWRLVGPRLYRYFTESSNHILAKVFTPEVIGTENPRLETKRRKCWREMPEFPSHHPKFESQAIPWMPHLEAEYCGQRLKCGKVCPHRGISLEGLPVVDGAVVCPGHGLKWNITTGELVRRTTEEDRKSQAMCPVCSGWCGVIPGAMNGSMQIWTHYNKKGKQCEGSLSSVQQPEKAS